MLTVHCVMSHYSFHKIATANSLWQMSDLSANDKNGYVIIFCRCAGGGGCWLATALFLVNVNQLGRRRRGGGIFLLTRI